MSFRKRLRVILASFTQNWITVRCACGTDIYVSDTAGNLLDGMKCDACESAAFDQWEKDFTARQESLRGEVA